MNTSIHFLLIQIVVLFIFYYIMVHIIAPNPAKRQDLLTSIANERQL
jgi:thiosulfate reductase cytochrome b subunit